MAEKEHIVDESVLKEIGVKINQLRIDRNYSFQILADDCNMGKSQLIKLCNSGTNFTVSTLSKLCVALKVEPNEIITKEILSKIDLS